MKPMNSVDRPISPVFAKRWSPYVFDASRSVSREDLEALFEAARWTMSAFNEQPWRYVVGVRGRGQATWDKVYESLLEGNRGWAIKAPVLALGFAKKHYEHNGKPNHTALHDLGAASAALTFEATSRGLVVHQMAGIDRHRIGHLFKLPEDLEPVTGLAIGYPGDLDAADSELAKRDRRKRERKSIEDLVVVGGF